MLNTDNAAVYTDFNGLAKLKQGAREQTPEAIKEVAKQFESVFLNMVLKSMRQAKLAEGALDSQQGEFFRDMYDQQIALHLSEKGGIGLADMIAKQLSPKQPKTEEKMQTGEYLQRALGVGNDGMPVNAARSAAKPALSAPQDSGQASNGVQPLDASGLSRLQASLDRMEQQQQALEQSWQALQEKAVVGDVGEVALNKQMFMDQLLPEAQQAAGELGVDPNVLLAQAALETGWGQSVIKNGRGENSFNLFNIKADRSWQGKQTRVATLEYADGVAKKEMAGFRAYESYKESFNDYVNFIKSNPRYSEALKKAGNAAQYVRELQKAGYATDPRYAEKIMSIYNNQLAGQNLASAG